MKDIYNFLDIHSHNHEADENRIISLDYNEAIPDEGYYSIGLHPWSTADLDKDKIDGIAALIAEKAKKKNVIAIGECGLDKLRGADESLQLYALEKQIEISESIGKPLILHIVKSFDNILALKKRLDPKQLWIIHGFRGKKQLAQQLIDKGIGLSYGHLFNRESVSITPKTLLFSETDESCETIESIRHTLLKNC